MSSNDDYYKNITYFRDVEINKIINDNINDINYCINDGKLLTYENNELINDSDNNRYNKNNNINDETLLYYLTRN